MEGAANAVVGDAVWREVVGADFFFASAGADLAAALGGILFRFLAFLAFEQTCPQDRQGAFLVLDLAAAVLTTNDGAGRDVHHLDGGIGRVHALAARAAARSR